MSVTGCKLPYCAHSRCTPNALLDTGQTGAPSAMGISKQAYHGCQDGDCSWILVEL